jgi:hypothetical protein
MFMTQIVELQSIAKTV